MSIALVFSLSDFLVYQMEDDDIVLPRILGFLNEHAEREETPASSSPTSSNFSSLSPSSSSRTASTDFSSAAASSILSPSASSVPPRADTRSGATASVDSIVLTTLQSLEQTIATLS
jgi:hypothetical protein